jgi:hypothetical protein
VEPVPNFPLRGFRSGSERLVPRSFESRGRQLESDPGEGVERDPYRNPLLAKSVPRNLRAAGTDRNPPVDRETARRNMTAGMIAAGFAALVFALCFIVALLYIAHG